MKLYNTLTRKIEELKPIDEQNVRVYSCGPTVYDHAHIGNLASYIFADTLRRAITLSDYRATQVMNITDVEDKIILRSKQTYLDLEPMKALQELTTKYATLFFDDMKKIGNDIDGITFIRATDHIEAMKQLIIQLHQKGFAYIADDGVYFSLAAYKKSGKTYGQLLKIDLENTSQARIQNDEYDKESAHDFALWKTQKNGEPAWEFELDGKNLAGRPGWHIECSAMSRQILGQPFDIHTGGIDLVFPHHENEIAQSTAGEDNPTMATIFAHNEHLLVDGKKMSKSLNNFYTLDDIVAKGFDPLAFRLLILQSHYRSQMHFSWKNLEAAHIRLQDFRYMADLRWQLKLEKQDDVVNFADSQKKLLENMASDLNTPQLFANLSGIENLLQKQLVHVDQEVEFREFLAFLDDLLGLHLLDSADITPEQKQLIVKREEARADKDWVGSDKLRDTLKQQSIGLKDTDNGSIWFREDMV